MSDHITLSKNTLTLQPVKSNHVRSIFLNNSVNSSLANKLPGVKVTSNCDTLCKV